MTEKEGDGLEKNTFVLVITLTASDNFIYTHTLHCKYGTYEKVFYGREVGKRRDIMMIRERSVERVRERRGEKTTIIERETERGNEILEHSERKRNGERERGIETASRVERERE